MPGAIDREGSRSRAGRGPTGRIREGHCACCVEGATGAHASGEQLAIRGRTGAVQDVDSKNVRRAVGDARRVCAEDISSVWIEGDNAILQVAVFLGNDYWYARTRGA